MSSCVFFNDTATTEIYTLSLHDALPIFIVLGGSDWWKSMGTEKSPGPKIYSISGHVKNPGQYECPLGVTLRELLEMAGGIREGHRLKFWTPGGSSTPYFTEEHLDVPLDFEGAAAGKGRTPGRSGGPWGVRVRGGRGRAGATRGGPGLNVWTPGGSSTPYFPEERLDVPRDFEGAAAAGSMLGATAVMIFDETIC